MHSVSLIDNRSSDDLDLSWIEEDTRMSEISQNYLRENMKYIYTYCIYIGKGHNIDKIVSSVQELSTIDQSTDQDQSNNQSIGICQSDVSQLIQTNQLLSTGVKYQLLDILLYNVDLEPENIQGFSKTENLGNFTSRFLKTCPLDQAIPIPASIFIFHNLNALYFIFQEVDKNIKSALKTDGISKKKKTKRVSIHSKNQTRKYQE